MAAEVDPGFTPRLFAEALAGVDRFPDQEFASYGFDAERIAAVKRTMRSWSTTLTKQLSVAPDEAAPTRSRTPRAQVYRSPDSGYQPPALEGPSL